MECVMTREFFDTLSPHKKLFFTMERTFDQNFAIAMLNLEYAERKRDILFKEAELKVLVENGSDEMLEELYTESEKESKAKVSGAIGRVIDSIINFFHSVSETISSKVRTITAKLSKNNLTAQDFAGSEMFNVALNMDYEKKMAEIDAKMNQGQKLIQQISMKTNVDETVIDGYCQACQKLKENTPKLVVKGVKVGALSGFIVYGFKNYGKIAGRVVKWIESGEKKVNELKGKLKGKTGDIKQQTRVLNELQSLSMMFGSISTQFITGISSICSNIGK